MNDSLHFIDSYFNKTLPASEKQAFEERCISDPVFAEEVAFYVSARDHIKSELHEQKKIEFAQLHARLSLQKPAPGGKTRNLFRVVSIAAAFLVIFLGWQLIFKVASPEKIADQYISNNLANLGKTMGGSPDSLQTGISAYNQKDYNKAEEIFGGLAKNPKADPESIKYLGIAYLAKGDYDKALIQFEQLSGIPLFANPGPFYQALTLMKRSTAGDREKAKKLLEEVIQKDMPGRKEAEIWIKKL